MSSKFVDTTAIMQVIGCVYNDPSILDCDQDYSITEEDFQEEFQKIIFGSIYKLHELGAKKITIETINDFLESRPKSKGIYEAHKGNEYLTKLSGFATAATFNYYYKRMKKMALLRAYDNMGLDMSFLYDVDNILDSKKKQAQEEWLDNSDLQKIADIIDEKISNIRLEYVENNGEEGATLAGDGLLELIEEFEKSPDIGVPLYGHFINTITRGARLGKFYLRSAPTGVGKAIPNYTKIPTPTGWRAVGDIRPGDYLFARNGAPTKVLKVYPQPEEKEIWQVKFADGRIAECCKEHLWEYQYRSHRGYATRVESAEVLYQRAQGLKNNFKDDTGRGFRFRVPINQPVKYPEATLPIHPYVMGAILGDGSLRYSRSNKAFTFSSADEELPTKIAKLLGGYVYKKSSNLNYGYTFKPVANLTHNLWVEELLIDYPLLWNCKSEDKFIPRVYLEGSVEQRFELLRGLMDTDGSIDTKGRTSFTTVSPQLRDNIIELCKSLGMFASYELDKRTEKYATDECYIVYIQCKKDIKNQLFSLKRKVNIADEYMRSPQRSERKDYLAIEEIIPTKKKTEMTCFTVDNSEHLFLMNDFIVTHNTRSMIADACYIACHKIYDEQFGWISNGAKEPTLFIATEQEKKEIQSLMLAFLSNVNEEHILQAKYVGDEKERVLTAAAIIKDSPLYIEELPEFNLQDVENTIKKAIREHDIKYVFHDYIHTSLKILEEISRRAGKITLREDNVLFMLSVKLKDICNKYGIFLMSATQLNGDYQDAKTPDQNLLRGAKAIADKIDYGSILLPVKDTDLETLSNIISSRFAGQMPTIKMSVYKNRRGRYKDILLWCKADLGTCRIQPMFMTNFRYELQSIEDIKVLVKEESAFEEEGEIIK